jgi:hypothetical protein
MAIKITQVPSSRCLIIESNYNYYSIPLTDEVHAALPDIMSMTKVNHERSNQFTPSSDRLDLKLYIGEVEE